MVNEKVVRLYGVYFGGNANNGANCGFLYANTNNAPSNTNANIGSRLYFSRKNNVRAALAEMRRLQSNRKPCHKNGQKPYDVGTAPAGKRKHFDSRALVA